jgi:hypothetical protein
MFAAPKPRLGGFFSIQNEIRPADLYCYLCARFGPPNGLSNLLRTDDSDNLIHWEWYLRADPGSISILGTNFRTDFLVGGYEIDPVARESIIQQIKKDFHRYGSEMSKVRKSLEPWVEFINPYQRLRRSISQLQNQLDRLDIDIPRDSAIDLRDPAGPAKWTSMSERYSLASGLCFGIRAMLPVMAESFVNMLLYLLLRPEIKTDDRLRENVIRAPIDVRVKSLSINCIGFKHPIDYSAEPCARYHSLVNERNDLLHGNVTIDKLSFNELYFMGKVPIFQQYRSMWERSVGVEVGASGLAKLRDEVAIVDAFTDYLLSNVEDRIRDDVMRVLDTRDLGYNKVTGRTGVLFPSWLADFYADFDKDLG